MRTTAHRSPGFSAAVHKLPMAAAVLLLLGVMLLVVQTANAQQPTPTDDEVNRIAHQLYCPVCENTPLDVCPTEACRQWRDLIRQQLAEGWTEARIQQYFVDQYGARVLSEPPRSGLNWLIYILPPLIILGGVVILIRSLRSWTSTEPGQGRDGSPSESPESPDGVNQDEYVSRFEDELEKHS